jgi:hypothetical protein
MFAIIIPYFEVLHKHTLAVFLAVLVWRSIQSMPDAPLIEPIFFHTGWLPRPAIQRDNLYGKRNGEGAFYCAFGARIMPHTTSPIKYALV